MNKYKFGRVLASLKELQIGQRIVRIADSEGNLHSNNPAVVIDTATRDEYVEQFAIEENPIIPITKKLYIDNPKCNFYRVSID